MAQNCIKIIRDVEQIPSKFHQLKVNETIGEGIMSNMIPSMSNMIPSKIIRDVDHEQHDPLSDGFVHFQLVKFCINARTQYMSANIMLPPEGHF